MMIMGARGETDGTRLLESLKSLVRETGVEFQVFDAAAVFGRAHLLSAVEHARRAFERGENLAEGLAMEVLLYASGDRQIKSALERVGVRDDTGTFALVVLGDASGVDVPSALGLERDDGVLDGPKDPGRFGITDAELETVGRERATDLVLERVAMLDIGK